MRQSLEDYKKEIEKRKPDDWFWMGSRLAIPAAILGFLLGTWLG